MIIPTLVHHELTLTDGEETTLILESLLSTEYLVNPVVSVWNTSSEGVSLVDNVGRFATDVDNIYTKTLQSNVAIDASGILVLSLLNSGMLLNNETYPLLTHTITLLYTAGVGAPASVQVRVLVTGYFDNGNATSLLVYRNVT